MEGDRYPPPHAGGVPPGVGYPQPHHAHHMGRMPPSVALPLFLPPPSQHSQFAPGYQNSHAVMANNPDYQNSHAPSGSAADAAMRHADDGDLWRLPVKFGARQVATATILEMHLAGLQNREASGACAARTRFVRARRDNRG